MTDHVRYLKLEPETFELEAHQLWQIDICQFCGNDSFRYQKYLPNRTSKSMYNQGILFTQRCNSCNKTVSTVKVPEKTPQD